MEKIKTYLKQMGGSDELTKAITESLAEYKNKVDSDAQKKIDASKTELKEHFSKQMDKARQVCVEEVSQYKKNLAKKVQVFLESKAEKIESQVAKQAMIEESASTSKLQQIAAMVGGASLESIEAGNAELQAAKREIKKLNEEKAKAQQDKAKAESECVKLKTVVENAQSLASKTIERNKQLSDEINNINESKKSQSTVSESKEAPTAAKPVAKPVIVESKNVLPARKANPVVASRSPQVATKKPANSEIANIASQID